MFSGILVGRTQGISSVLDLRVYLSVVVIARRGPALVAGIPLTVLTRLEH